MPQPVEPRGISRRHFLQGATMATAAAALLQQRAHWTQPIAANAEAQIPDAPQQGTPSQIAPLPIIALNRMAFGPTEADLADFMALGGSDSERLNNYINQQLDPGSIDDSAFEARFASAGFTTFGKTREQYWLDHVAADGIDWQYRNLPLRELERAIFLRAVYSKRQLTEIMADFWHNHFSVYGWMSPIQSMMIHFDQACIRAHMFGNFRELLGAVAKSTTMLYYLDQYSSQKAGPNENYARELFELHTLGAENYFGVLRQSEVPTDPDGRPLGYVDDDVYEATRALTGWTIDNHRFNDTGVFHYEDSWHDRFQKFILGNFLPPDQGPLADGEQLLDYLAEHPGTARFICRKLCRRLVSDSPPDPLVEGAAAIFHANVGAPDQLTQVYRYILQSADFQTSWGKKIRRPFEMAVGLMRSCNADLTIKMDDPISDQLMYNYDRMGQPPFSWRPPNGYPDVARAWQSTTPLVMRWRFAGWFLDRRDDNDIYYADVVTQTPAGIRTAETMADYWIDRIIGYPMRLNDRGVIVSFMADTSAPTDTLDLDNDDRIQHRLRSMVALILNSPEYQWR